MADVMSVSGSTDSYESWLAGQVDVVKQDLEGKHARMREGAFTFFRGTYYRWLETVGVRAPDLDGPIVMSVGDLHVENFGTWRDGEGRLVWGVNDFDESEELPYSYDLARLATSVTLAIDDAGLNMTPRQAHKALLAGYAKQLNAGGEPYVLAGKHKALTRLVADALPGPKRWWRRLTPKDRSVATLPDAALAALAEVAPSHDWEFEAHPRVAGVGSLGHPRFVVVGERDGAPAARELKQLSPPAGQWLRRPATPSVVDAAAMVRSHDPLYRIKAGWLARRVAPDCIKLELARIRRAVEDRRIFSWMGAETANIHLANHAERIAGVRADLEGRDAGWLTRAAGTLATAARDDWSDYRRVRS